MESALPDFKNSVAWSRLSAGINSISGKAFVASCAMELVSSSGKMSFIGLLYHRLLDLIFSGKCGII